MFSGKHAKRTGLTFSCLVIFPAVAGLIALRYFGLPSTANPEMLDLLSGKQWQLAGASFAGNALHIRYIGLALARQDGGAGQANPPVNLYGVRLQTSGGFTIRAVLSGITGRADIALYGQPPLIEDELRAEEGTMSVSLNGSRLSASLSDQTRGSPAATMQAAIQTSRDHQLRITDDGGSFRFSVDGRSAGPSMPDYGIFKTGRIWIGVASASPGGSFTINALSAQTLPGGAVALADTSQLQLKQDPAGIAALAQKSRPGFQFGAAVALGPLVADQRYASLFGNFNAVTTENVGKFQALHPLPGDQPADYDFTDMDAVVALAARSGRSVHGHALVFGEANPQWVRTMAKTHPDRLQAIMTGHIKSVVGHYKGLVRSWDVVNEPLADYGQLSDPDGLRLNIWYDAIGPGYIAAALQAAHAADPSAGLWINEFGLESDDNRFGQILALAKRLRSDGVPLTGIGFQAHLDSGDTIDNDTHIDTAILSQRFAALAALGLKVRISELDVSDASEYPAFADVVGTCLRATTCDGVTLWGITDKYSSSGSLDGRGIFRPGTGLPWDNDEQALPAAAEIRRAVRAP